MAQFIQQDSGLGGALAHSGQMLGQILSEVGKRQQQKQYNTQLEDILGSIGPTEISDEAILQVSQTNPQLGRILQTQQKAIKQTKKEGEDTNRVSSAVRNMLKVLPSVGPGQLGNLLTEKGRMNRQYFDSLAMNLEEIAATMVGKGTLSKPRFEFLMKNLPSSKKTQAANKGALKAWSETLGLDVPEFGEEEVETEVEEKSSSDGKELTVEMAQSILQQAKGDKDLARKIARKRGFKF